MKALIFGVGSIGQRHLYNLKKLKVDEIAICDVNKKIVFSLSNKFKIKKFSNIDDAFSFNPEISLICTPSNTHLKIIQKCLKANSHVFVEKPISNSLEGVENSLKIAKKKNLKIAVGYNTRFDNGLALLKKKLNNLEIGRPLSILSQWGNNIRNWNHPNFLNHYILQKNGGIILDDSHEYDYLRWLLDDEVKTVYCQTQQLHSIKTSTESLASIILKFKRGTIATLIIDYVRPRYERNCHIIGENGSLHWEFSRKPSTKLYQTKSFSKVTKTKLIKSKNDVKIFQQNLNNSYILELKNFINSIKLDQKPFVDGLDAYKTLKIGMAALKSSESGKIISL